MLWLTCIFLLQHYVLTLTSVYCCHVCCPSPSFLLPLNVLLHTCVFWLPLISVFLLPLTNIFLPQHYVLCYVCWHVVLYLAIIFFYCHWMCCCSIGFSCCNIIRYHWLVLLLCCLSQSTLLPLKVLHFFAAGLYSATHFHFLLSALCVATLHILLFPFCTF